MASPLLLDGPRLAPASGTARAVVVLVHGYGSNGADMISLAPLWADVMPDAAFVAPNAPQRCPGAPGGYQWWTLGALTPAMLAVGAASAAPALNTFIDAELARHALPPERLLLVGFSQGTMMVLHVGPRRPQRIAGIVGYSGALADVGTLTQDMRSRPPVLLLHGDADPVVPVAALHAAETRLSELGFDVATRITSGLGHGIDADGIAAGATFGQRVLSA